MDSRKFIHVLLIVALCYGQLAASVHLVGHLNDSACEGFSLSAPETCSIHHTGAHPDHAEHYHHNTAHQHAGTAHPFHQTGGERNTDNNCAIYHALLNLDCAIHTELTKSIAPGIAESTNYAAIYFAYETQGAQHIRAPPHHS